MTVFERYTDDAKEVVRLAVLAAQQLNHNYIGTEHILLGLLRQGDRTIASALSRSSVTDESVTQYVIDTIRKGGYSQSLPSEFTPRAKAALGNASIETLKIGRWSDGVTPACILLALIDQAVRLDSERGVAVCALAALGAGDFGALREDVCMLIEVVRRSPLVGG